MGICPECSGCRNYYGRIHMLFGMIYDCADECPHYQAKLKRQEECRLVEARRKEERHAKAVELQAKRRLRRLENATVDAIEPEWASLEFPRQYKAGWRYKCNATYSVWVHLITKQKVIGTRRNCVCPGFEFPKSAKSKP